MRFMTRLITLALLLFLSSSPAFAGIRLKLTFTGTCDAWINNYPRGPEEVVKISDGTDCTLVVQATRRRNGKRTPLRNVEVSFVRHLASDTDSPKTIDTGRTDQKGRVTFEFDWEAEACYYHAESTRGGSTVVSTMFGGTTSCYCPDGDCGV